MSPNSWADYCCVLFLAGDSMPLFSGRTTDLISNIIYEPHPWVNYWLFFLVLVYLFFSFFSFKFWPSSWPYPQIMEECKDSPSLSDYHHLGKWCLPTVVWHFHSQSSLWIRFFEMWLRMSPEWHTQRYIFLATDFMRMVYINF